MPCYRSCFDLRFRQLTEFYRTNNRWPSIHSKDKLEKSLGLWCHSQRLKYNKDRIDPYAVHQLERIQFPWSLMAVEWEKKFGELKAFISEHKKLPPGKHPLYSFSFRHYKEFSHLTDEKKKALRDIGFVQLWENRVRQRKHRWDDCFKKVKLFFEQHGRLPSMTTDRQLYTWIKAQRQQFRKGRLAKEKVDKLQEAGIPLLVRPAVKKVNAWEEQYRRLKHFVLMNQRLPYCKEDRDLYGWCLQQRRLYTHKKLSNERMEKMKALDVNLEIRKRAMVRKVEALERCA